MSIPVRRPLHERFYTCRIDDVSTADNVSIPIVTDGILVSWSITLNATITGTAALTVEVDGTADADAAQSLVALALKTPQKKDIAGGVHLREGQNLEFITDGGSTTASEGWIVAVVRDT